MNVTQTLQDSKIFIIQLRAKRKTADWRDYMIFNISDDALREFRHMQNHPYSCFLDRRDARIIYREIKEELLPS